MRVARLPRSVAPAPVRSIDLFELLRRNAALIRPHIILKLYGVLAMWRSDDAFETKCPPGCGSHRGTIAYVRVQCYSGVKANERPVRFELDGREYIVEEIVDQWYGPDDTFFKLRADDDNIYILRHSPDRDVWSLESFLRS
jgi:hypothetical protein